MSDLSWLGRSPQVFFVDLLLAGDNAIAIALLCRSLPQELLNKASLLGALTAIVPRLALAAVAGYLMEVPGLQLVGALLLAIIAVNLVAPAGRTGPTLAATDSDAAAPAGSAAANMWAAGVAIAVVNLVMSLDNTVALAAVTQGNVFYLALGLAFSVPILIFGNIALVALFRRRPALVVAGGTMLGWCAGAMAVSDPLVLPWIAEQAPGLSVVVPLLVAVYVLAQARMEAAEAAAPAGGPAAPVAIGPHPMRAWPQPAPIVDAAPAAAPAAVLVVQSPRAATPARAPAATPAAAPAVAARKAGKASLEKHMVLYVVTALFLLVEGFFLIAQMRGEWGMK